MKKLPLILPMLALSGVASGEFADPPWRYTLEEPAAGWTAPDFDDSGWKEGEGGFGQRSTPGARVNTEWDTADIWLRRTVQLESKPERPALYIYHDEDAQVYLNGRIIAAFNRFITDYQVVPLDEAGLAAVRQGANLLAVHCRQTTGGQAIDVHLIDADNVPELPPAKRPDFPFKSQLVTEWGAGVTADNAWKEYPRPALVRDNHTNLNGHWDYAITASDATCPEKWDGRILVPFAVESRLSGVQRLLHEGHALWYHRPIAARSASEARVILNFEASDYRTQVWVNKTEVGTHTGGNTPFSFDITDALAPADNHLYVRVEDATSGYQLRGKQTQWPGGIWYTQVSGLWGTVWSEEVSADHIERLTVTTRIDGSVTIRIHGTTATATVIASLDGKEVARASGSGDVRLTIPDPKLWSPDSPTLYDLEVTTATDKVRSYAGIREVGRIKDADGHWRFTLNGEVLFHWGTLDQGWWPDGLLTPPSDAAMRWDVDYLKASGFNMIRKHIKVEPRRFYSYCDQAGMLVWQDHVAGGPGPRWTRLAPDPRDAEWPDPEHEQFMLELDRMITTLENHPCIAVWVPFNEAWGQHRTVAVGNWTRERDPSRSVNVASGGNFWPAGDVVDHHEYPHPGFPFELDHDGRFDDYVKVVGEFGGHGLPTPGHLWDDSTRNWGYGGLPKDAAEYKERYRESLRLLVSLKSKGIAAGVYTQTTDVEGEINGLVTYDRKRVKIPAQELRELHAPLTNRWPADKANAWYERTPWPVGANFVPSSAINQLEMWQADTFDPDTIDRELGWAATLGMNTMRVFLHDIAWRTDPEAFFGRVDRYLELADKHGIGTMFVLFDGVWQPYPKAGRQPEPRPGLHNSGWVQSPGREILENPGRHDELEPYVRAVLEHYRNDRRVLVWDLFNEPDNPNRNSYGEAGTREELAPEIKAARAGELLLKAFQWARSVNPSQPLTAGVWRGDYLGAPSPFDHICLDHSDVISFHTYDNPERARALSEGLLKLGRPVFCTEYMARGNDSTFQGILPIFHERRIAAYNWGFVNGRSQTIYPWDSWQKPYDSEPDPWFHDIFRQDGSHYNTEETSLIRRLTATPARR